MALISLRPDTRQRLVGCVLVPVGPINEIDPTNRGGRGGVTDVAGSAIPAYLERAIDAELGARCRLSGDSHAPAYQLVWTQSPFLDASGRLPW